MWTSINKAQKLIANLQGYVLCLLIFIGIGDGIFSSSALGQVGLMPVPVLKDVKVQAEVRFDPNTMWYTYTYIVNNPATNTGQIWDIEIDATQAPGWLRLDSTGLTIPIGPNLYTFNEELADLQPLDLPVGWEVVPFGQRVPSGWNGGLSRNGFAGFSSSGPSVRILPGQSRSFELISPGVPIIRETAIDPYWVFIIEDHEQVTEEEDKAAGEIERNIIFHTYTLGPSGIFPGAYEHWNQLRDNLNQAIQLGWIPDPTLADTLVAQLASAREALDASDGTLAKTRLQLLLDTLAQSAPSQRHQEAHDLIFWNVKQLIEHTPDTPVPFEPKATLSPESITLPIGTLYTLTATVINLGDNKPVPDFPLTFEVVEGPHAGLRFDGTTDNEGKIIFSYTGTRLGTDKILLTQEIIIDIEVLGGNGGTVYGSAEVTWTGGPDLIIKLFIPPLIKAKGGQLVTITEITANNGNIQAGPSVTRYFLSENAIIEPEQDRAIGERPIPPLGIGESSEGVNQEFRFPDDLLEGTYYLGACADADSSVIELDEENNCQVNQIAVALEPPSNQPPECTQANPSSDRLWPPNHRLVTISVNGITDPDGDPINITITQITQDEPVNGLGDGDTSPDGFGVGTTQAQVRAERSGTGNGRVYAISFTANDGKGGTCTGKVTVGVPHDMGKGAVPIDDGQNYDSTLP